MSSGVARSDAEAASGTPLVVSGVTRDGVARAGRPGDARGSRALGGRGRGADVADGGGVAEGGRGVSAVISEARIVPLRPRGPVLSLSRGGPGCQVEKPSAVRTVIRRADANAARLRARGHPSRSRLGRTSRRAPRDSTRRGRRGSHCGASAAGAFAFCPVRCCPRSRRQTQNSATRWIFPRWKKKPRRAPRRTFYPKLVFDVWRWRPPLLCVASQRVALDTAPCSSLVTCLSPRAAPRRAGPAAWALARARRPTPAPDPRPWSASPRVAVRRRRSPSAALAAP